MTRPLIFVGHRTNLRELIWACKKLDIELVGILDHQLADTHTHFFGVPVLGDERRLLDHKDSEARSWLAHCDFFAANTMDGRQVVSVKCANLEHLKFSRLNLLEQVGARIINIIDPDNPVFDRVRLGDTSLSIGRGNFIAQTAEIGFGVEIGNFNMLESQCYIGYDSVIHDNVVVCPMSKVFYITIESHCCIGMYSTVQHPSLSRQSKYSIGKWSTTWTRSIIDRDVPQNSVLTHTGRIMKKYRALDWAQLVDQ